MKFSIEYLAGIVDGEGCIFVQKDTRRATDYMLWMQINMCHRPFIQMLADELDASVIVHRKDLKNPKHRAAYEVSLHGKRATKFLQEVFPHLIIKQEEARIALALQDNITRYHHSIATMSPDEMQKIIQFRENCRLQLKAAKRQSFIGAAEALPVRDGHAHSRLLDNNRIALRRRRCFVFHQSALL